MGENKEREVNAMGYLKRRNFMEERETKQLPKVNREAMSEFNM